MADREFRTADVGDEIERTLAVLVGLPLWGTARGGSMQGFAFGQRVPAVAGSPRKVGEYALHVNCAWRLRDSHRVVVGSDDLLVPAASHEPTRRFRVGLKGVDFARFEWDAAGASRRDERIEALFAVWDAASPLVRAVEGDDLGGLRLDLDTGHALELFPCDSLDDYEYWRFFHQSGEDFVVTAAGIET
jgi:hypothetical protein